MRLNISIKIIFSLLKPKSIATLQAEIVIDQDYPKIAPLFAINVNWNYERNSGNDEAIRV